MLKNVKNMFCDMFLAIFETKKSAIMLIKQWTKVRKIDEK